MDVALDATWYRVEAGAEYPIAIPHVYTDVVRTTEYFDRKIRDRGIEQEWRERAVENPVATELQEDGRVRYWAYVEEAGHYLRVVTEPDGALLNAFFDRTFERRRAK